VEAASVVTTTTRNLKLPRARALLFLFKFPDYGRAVSNRCEGAPRPKVSSSRHGARAIE
jgi:hypothetical protein